MKDQSYKDEVASYDDDELNDAIAWTEIEVADLAGYELAEKFDCPSYDLECLRENLNLLKAEKNRREGSAV